MKHYLKPLFFCLFLAFYTGCKTKEKKTDETVSVSKKTETWQSLFNGKNLDGWIPKISGYPLNENYNNTFKVENGAIKVSYENYETFTNQFGHLFYKIPFSNYKLRLKYRFTGNQANGGEAWAKKNSGIMIHCQSPESMELDQSFPVSLEVQLLGGIEDGVARPTGNLCTPGTHVHLNKKLTTAHCTSSSSETYYGDQWVTAEVEVYSDSLINHKINGTVVLSYTKPVYGGDFNASFKEGTPVKGGYISLQSESHPIEFKNIEILEL